ncbi:MAG: HEPN domain-containing protein [Planctomycetes bacterium]|nr:HEPN domain-containing protein [Planctomycetota bacterium]
MNAGTREWIEKAEADFRSAERENRVRTAPNRNLACFLCQQCIEKYLKACLHRSGLRIPKTHQLPDLLNLLLSEIPEWELWRPELRALTLYAVDYRYPGKNATKAQVHEAMARCRNIRKVIREYLGLSVAARPRAKPKKRPR